MRRSRACWLAQLKDHPIERVGAAHNKLNVCARVCTFARSLACTRTHYARDSASITRARARVQTADETSSGGHRACRILISRLDAHARTHAQMFGRARKHTKCSMARWMRASACACKCTHLRRRREMASAPSPFRSSTQRRQAKRISADGLTSRRADSERERKLRNGALCAHANCRQARTRTLLICHPAAGSR